MIVSSDMPSTIAKTALATNDPARARDARETAAFFTRPAGCICLVTRSANAGRTRYAAIGA